MSVTAVPIRPLKNGSVARLWIAIAGLSLGAAGLAYAGTRSQTYTTTPSGLQYQVVEEGTGAMPTATDIVLIDYTGKLADGSVFDSSEGKQPLPLPVTGSIPGFSEGLQLMKKGGTYRLRIPPALGYGSEPVGPQGQIPANSTLDFEVKLLEIAPQSALQGPPGAPPQLPPGM